MATFHFDLVSPEKLLFSSEVTQVDVPGTEGNFGVLAGHAPMVTTVRPGILVIYGEAGEQLRVVVNGGFAEVGPSGLTVLADTAVALEEFDRSTLAELIKDTAEDVADATDPRQRDKLSRKLEQLRTLETALAR
jgi:F-type H+-transporting ATPase subunit epsilon